MRRAQTLGVLTLATVLLAAAPAAASCGDERYDDPPPPITSMTPEPGASIEQSSVKPLWFVITTPLHRAFFSIRIATDDRLGNTGILSDLNTIESFSLLESYTDFGYYSSSGGFGLRTWPNIPRTYYWQLYASWDDETGCHQHVGPVHTLTITPSAPSKPSPPPPGPGPITPQDARRSARRMISERTGTRPSLRISCSTIDTATLRCRLSWKSRRHSYRAAGTFSRVSYSVTGTRTRRSCKRRCATRFRWSA